VITERLHYYKRFALVNVFSREWEASDALIPQSMGLISMISVDDNICVVERAEENRSNGTLVSFGYILMCCCLEYESEIYHSVTRQQEM
jgi:hypothetical protein